MIAARRFASAVSSQTDVERTRRAAREIATRLGFDRQDAEAIAIAATELATNLVRHAQHGTIVIAEVTGRDAAGILIASQDSGPGIADVALALQDGYSTRSSLGSGLPAVRRLMDELTIDSSPGGTTIEARKWTGKKHRSPSR
jgi:serine/threonine-protein kinase RsbT